MQVQLHTGQEIERMKRKTNVRLRKVKEEHYLFP